MPRRAAPGVAVTGPPPAGATADVVIAGAGLAGLAAARALSGAGQRVLVLEARSRVGGRMADQSVIEGGSVDLGGQWVGPTQDRILALAADLGMRRFPSYHRGRSVFHFHGRRTTFGGSFAPFRGEPPDVPAASLHDALQAVAAIDELAAQVPPEAPWRARGAAALDRQTLASWLDQNTSTEFARFVLTQQALIGGSGAFEPAEASLLHAAFTHAQAPQGEDPEAELFHGGAGTIPRILAGELGDQVLLSSPVRSIEQDGSAVTMSTDAGRFRAPFGVVAMAPSLAGQICYTPSLPAQRVALTRGMPMGSLIKMLAVYPTAFWRAEGLSGTATGDLPAIQFAADSSPPEGTPGVLASFVAGDRAVAMRGDSPAGRRRAVLADLARYLGPAAASPAQFLEVNWPAERWTGGAFTAFMPPGGWTGYGATLRAPVGRIHWAGAETAARWNGYFDGAVRSGQDAAAAILALL